MTLRYIFAPGTANEKVLTEEDIVSHNPVRTHTGLSDLSATIIEDRSLDPYAQRQDRLNVEVDGAVKWTGYIVGLSHNIGQGNSRFRAEGIAKRLKETRPDYASLGGSLSYSNISLEDAIDDYWARTPFTSYSVTPQSTEIVAQDTVLQEADTNTEFNNVISPAATDPVVVQNGKLELAQSGFFAEVEDFGNGTVQSNADASGGQEVFYTIGGDNYSFNLDYTIPESEVGYAFRFRIPSGATQNGITLQIDGQTVETISSGVFSNSTFDWFISNFWSNGDLTAGSHTAGFELTANGEDIIIDCVHVYDERYSYNFDNTVDANNALSGPELYPTEQVVALSTVPLQRKTDAAEFTSTWSNTDNDQYIEVSNDGGSNYQRVSNSQSGSVTFASLGDALDTNLSLDRYDDGGSGTPQQGNAGQTVDSWTLFTKPDAVTSDDIGEALARAIVAPGEITGDTVREAGLKNGSTLLTRHILAEFTVLQDQRLASSETTRFTSDN